MPKDDTTENKHRIHEEMTSKVKKGESDAKENILNLLRDKSSDIGSQEKNFAIQIAEENKMVEAIPYLYPLLKQITVFGVGEKVKDPTNAIMKIGSEGLEALFKCLEEDDKNAIPYQTITSI